MNVRMLKAQMALAGMNAGDLCEKIGISRASYYKKIAGVSEFTQGEIAAISEALHMDRETILNVFFAAEVS